MGVLQKKDHRGTLITLEQIEAQELREIARKYGGSFDSEFGIYFSLTTSENNLFANNLLRDPVLYESAFIGNVGVFPVTKDDREICGIDNSGIQIEDLMVAEKFQRQGYAEFLVNEALDWLKNQKISVAYIIAPVFESVCLLDKLKQQNKIDYEIFSEHKGSNLQLKKSYKLKF
jgi:GNAT superfamily N-acetyltransferase